MPRDPRSGWLSRVARRSRLLEGVLQALKLLPGRSRLRLLLLVLANMTTAFLDLVGIALVGLVSVLLVTYVQTDGSTTTVSLPFSDLLSADGLQGTRGIMILGLAAALFLMAKSILGTYLARRTLLFLAGRQADVSELLTSRLLRLPLVEIEARSSQETAFSLTAGVNAAIVGLLGSSALALSEISLLVVLGVALMVVNTAVTLAAVIFFALLALFMHLVLGSWASATGHRMSTTNFTLMRAIQEALLSYREITVFDRMGTYTSRLSALIQDGARASATFTFIGQVPKYVYETSLLLGALALGAYEFSQQDPRAAVATVSIFLAAGSRIMPSMLRLQNCLVSIRSSAGQASPTFELFNSLEGDDESSTLAVPRKGAPDGSGLTREPFVPEVELIDVSVTYPNTQSPALSDVTLHIKAGTTVAVVGPTGAGKSTLADVILGVLPVAHGEVRVGGMDPRTAIHTWAGRLAYVPQQVSLITGSVRENIGIGLAPEQIDDERVWLVLRMVRLDAFLSSQREGLDTEVGERGVRFSGGQRQRLGLARALYSEPLLLVLDEATSALDAETEAAITGTLAELRGKVTTVVIAHRLATVRNSDEVVYVEGGRVLARGSFEDVRRQVSRFDETAKLLGL
jgi:ABC-type multidrug transport system fused ATPase/permease subunit